MTEQEKLHGFCIWLVKLCRETNAESFTYTIDGMTFEGKPIGDWEITVKRKSPPLTNPLK